MYLGMAKEVSYTQGKFKPKNPSKYLGDPTNIVYRSSYELKFMQYCDLRENIISYQSEEFSIPYISPIDGKYHRYFPDFLIKYKDKTGKIRKAVIEIKPQKELKEPDKNPKRKTKSWAYQVKTWAINQQKWSAARKFCEERDWEFRLFSEKELGIEL